jgi:hypothetical protein
MGVAKSAPTTPAPALSPLPHHIPLVKTEEGSVHCTPQAPLPHAFVPAAADSRGQLMSTRPTARLFASVAPSCTGGLKCAISVAV